MIRKNLLQLIFSGACLWRWNDKLRPVELAEIEKQAHKMLVACALWHEASRDLPFSQRVALATSIIEGALFDYFYRLIITDIKPPVFYKIKQNRKHFEQLTNYALGRLEPVLGATGGFWQRMQGWHLQEGVENNLDRRILAASHLFASQWEFKLIQPHNPFDEEMPGIARSFDQELASFANLPGMPALLESGNALARYANLCGQLRFQIRWAQAPRLPATSVLGHMFIVAACAYMFSLDVGAGLARSANNFFSGLFHDFPELLTRDIISPVKKASPGLQEIIKEYENAELERRVFGPLREAGFGSFVNQIAWFLGLEAGSEFQDCYRKDGIISKVACFDVLQKMDRNSLDCKDGELLKVCDLLSAFLEAHNSIRNGVSSPHLLEARERLKSEIINHPPDCLQMGALLADFD